MKIYLKKCSVCCEGDLQLTWHTKRKSKEICLRCDDCKIFGLSDKMILSSIDILDMAIKTSRQNDFE
jgi:hypothetical protein